MSEFDVKFAAYERAMQANNYFGLKGEQISEQFGRYATGLQRDEIKAANKKEGRKFGKELAAEKKKLAAKELQAQINGSARNLPAVAGKPAAEKVTGLLPTRTVNTFSINDKYYIMENNRVTGLYDKLDKADWTKKIRELKLSGANIVQEMPYGEVSKSKSVATAAGAQNLDEIRKIALENARKAEGKFKGVTSEQIDERLGIGKESDATKHFRQEELKSNALANARKAEGKFKGVTSEQIDERLGIDKESDATKHFRQEELKSNALANARKAEGKFKGVTSEQIDERLGIDKESDATKHFRQEELKSKALANARKADGKFRGVTAEEIDKRLGIGEESPQTKFYRNLEKRGKKPRIKARARLFQMKNPKLAKAGKAGLIGLAAATVIGGLYALFKSDDKKDKLDMPDAAETPVEETPAVVADEPEQEPIEETPIEETPVVEPAQDGTYTVKEGDNVWNIAKRHLKDVNKDIKGYEPSPAEILKETKRLMELNGLEFDNSKERKNWFVMIRPGDVLKLTGEPVQETVEPAVVTETVETPAETVEAKPTIIPVAVRVEKVPPAEETPIMTPAVSEPVQHTEVAATGRQAIIDELNAKIQSGELTGKDLKKITKALKKHEKNLRKLEKLAEGLERSRHKYAIKGIKLEGKKNVNEDRYQTKKEVLEYKLENNY